ncbi:MAG: hypothetical protein GEU28_10020 [Dehalococcoidia bacterium]|nr:hypothetical protein [Dehalococcoidia bacterium]
MRGHAVDLRYTGALVALLVGCLVAMACGDDDDDEPQEDDAATTEQEDTPSETATSTPQAGDSAADYLGMVATIEAEIAATYPRCATGAWTLGFAGLGVDAGCGPAHDEFSVALASLDPPPECQDLNDILAERTAAIASGDQQAMMDAFTPENEKQAEFAAAAESCGLER